ncbi:MAG: hypothetical protein DBX00_10505 [Verrucomicrobia bacterium]|nr:hypothetical protein [Roseibacillus sp.]RCL34042.1 MAG: hypothetical protein DBX00_10505 [Verrucomicrobiota bacterium]
MKSLSVASALIILAHTVLAEGLQGNDTLNSLIKISSVEDTPLVFVGFDPCPTEQESESEVQDLRQDLRGAGARLHEARRAMEAVAEERDEARGEVSALTMANHRMLMEIRKLQKEKEQALQEGEVWKARAEQRMKPASRPDEEVVEIAGFKAEFHALREDLVRVRQELNDPIERANLREQLVAARAHGERLEKEITTLLESREEERRAAARQQRKMTAKVLALSSGAGGSDQLRDDLRLSKAGHVKALVDVELLKKDLVRAGEREERALAELGQVQKGVEALHAQKAAMAESRMLVQHDLDKACREVENLRRQIAKVRSEGEASRESVARLTLELAHSEEAHREAAGLSDVLDVEGELLAAPRALIEKGLEEGMPQDAAGSSVSDSGYP